MGEADGYRLGPVREVRTRDVRVTQGDLAGATADAHKTQARIDAANARVAAVRTALETARVALAERLAHPRGPYTGTTAALIVMAERHLGRLRRDLDAALDAVDRAVAAHRGQLDVVDAARGRLVRARADKEVIERHFTRWREQRRKLAERRED